MKKRLTRRQFLRGFMAAGAGLAAAYPVMIERNLLGVNYYRIPVSNLPRTFTGFKIVQLTDIHYGPLVSSRFVREVVGLANSVGGDLIVCTGDNVRDRDGSDQVDTVWPILSGLSAPYGVYSVLGNHDHWADFDRSMYWLERTGQNVRHRSVRLEKEGEHVWLGGAGDLLEDVLGVDPAFEGVDPAECKILLAHNPDSADGSFTTPIDLMICGHTHGGQVVVPFIGAPILPVRNKQYTSGFIATSRFGLFISRGVGWSILPVRANCSPEIAVLELYPS